MISGISAAILPIVDLSVASRASRNEAAGEVARQTAERQQPQSDAAAPNGVRAGPITSLINFEGAALLQQQFGGRDRGADDRLGRRPTEQSGDKPARDTAADPQASSQSANDLAQEAAADGSGQQKQPGDLSEAERRQIAKLKARDIEVRAHEAAHAGAGGAFAGSPSYEYETGPNGKKYAVGGEVPIDVSPVARDPQATIDKMNTVKAAASAPAQPSSQDRQVAARADAEKARAHAELLVQRREETQAKKTEQAEGDDGGLSISGGGGPGQLGSGSNLFNIESAADGPKPGGRTATGSGFAGAGFSRNFEGAGGSGNSAGELLNLFA